MVCNRSRFIAVGEGQGCSSQGAKAGWDGGGWWCTAAEGRWGFVTCGRVCLGGRRASFSGFPANGSKTPLKVSSETSLGGGMSNVGSLSVVVGGPVQYLGHYYYQHAQQPIYTSFFNQQLITVDVVLCQEMTFMRLPERSLSAVEMLLQDLSRPGESTCARDTYRSLRQNARDAPAAPAVGCQLQQQPVLSRAFLPTSRSRCLHPCCNIEPPIIEPYPYHLAAGSSLSQSCLHGSGMAQQQFVTFPSPR